MDWLKEVFYMKPLATLFLVGAAYVTALIYLYPKTAKKAEKAASENGLKQISLNMFGCYLNRTSCSCMKPLFDGSRFGAPVIEGIVTGRRDEFTITVFSFGLPTGRSGTWQTVIHLRHDPPSWLPIFSVVDEVAGKKMSSLLECEHTLRNPLINPNFIQRCDEANRIQATLSQQSVIDGRGIVLDSTGEDLFYYRQGETLELSELKDFIERAIKIWHMINRGSVDMSIFKTTENRKIIELNFLAKVLLLNSPAVYLIIAVGYGNSNLAAYILAVFGTIIVIAKFAELRRKAVLAKS
jgi:hypothetical protein